MPRPLTALLVLSCVLLFSVLILPSTGVLNSLIWRMEPPPLGPNGKNLAQALGYDKDSKLLVVNSDDTGANATFTHGIEYVMAQGLVQSTSIIVNDRNDAELARIAKLSQHHPDWGFGLHLMLTNEYQERDPWSPVLPKEQVPSLYNQQGLAWARSEQVWQHADPKDVEKEYKAQIQKALDAGINISHIDSHMGSAYGQSQFPGAQAHAINQAYVAAAQHFNLPLTLNTFDQKLKPILAQVDQAGLIRPDTFFGFYELEEMNSHLSYNGHAIKKWLVAWVVKNVFGFELPYDNQDSLINDVTVRMALYKTAIKNVTRPGLNHIFMHAASENGSDGIPIPEGKNHGTGLDRIVRLADSAIWSSNEMKHFLQEQNIKLVNYQQIKAVQQRWQTLRTNAKQVSSGSPLVGQ